MTANNQEYIEIEPFDREYGLAELLPITTLASLCRDAVVLLPGEMIILHEDGSVYYQHTKLQNGYKAVLSNTISQDQPQDEVCIELNRGQVAMVFPIIHELEIKGYLALLQQTRIRDASAAPGRSIAAILHMLMNLTHRTILTSGLHGTVVAESYNQLKEKAAQLARSEEKYRTLAAGLEIEVEHKTAEIRKSHAHMMQQEKLASIGQLSAGMAHEINNPLGFIISNLETLKEYATDLRALLDGYQRLYKLCDENKPQNALATQCQAIEDLESRLGSEYLLEDLPMMADESLQGAQRIKKIISDLKIVARPGEKDPEPIDIRRSIEAVLTVLDNRIESQISVIKDFDEIPQIFGHPREINQIWLNLILNALDAMGDKGTLTIATQSHSGQTLITVKDTGHGIEELQLPKIFDPFYTSKKVGSGIGLGLHLVFNIVQQHQGRIDVVSQVGKGSTFTVCLPSGRDN